MKSKTPITVLGAGILGLWQALGLAKAGFAVRLVESSATPFAASSSRYAGTMLAPECEAESAPAIVRDLGRRAIEIWRETYPDVVTNGSLVVAAARDRNELSRFATMTERHETLDGAALAKLEPSLAARFSAALFYSGEAHLNAGAALKFLLQAVRRLGVVVSFGDGAGPAAGGILIDCRGLAARDALPTLRGVRGERVLVRAPDVSLKRPVRFLHPRQPLYVVPQGDGQFVLGATIVENEHDGPMTVRAALEILGAAYALDPAFADADILEFGSGLRPAFPDNIPRAIVRDAGKSIFVNGAYRHGFLLAPILAEAVVGVLAEGRGTHALVSEV